LWSCTRWSALQERLSWNFGHQALCADLKSSLDSEIAKHGLHCVKTIANQVSIVPCTDGLVDAALPKHSAHTVKPAFGIDYDTRKRSGVQLRQVDNIAAKWGLYRRCPGDVGLLSIHSQVTARHMIRTKLHKPPERTLSAGSAHQCLHCCEKGQLPRCRWPYLLLIWIWQAVS